MKNVSEEKEYIVKQTVDPETGSEKQEPTGEELIRCKRCKHSDVVLGDRRCDFTWWHCKDTGYCDRGETKI